MEFDLSTILSLVTAFLAGGIIFLKVVAPRTKTKVDDTALAIAEKALEVLPRQIPGKASTPPPA